MLRLRVPQARLRHVLGVGEPGLLPQVWRDRALRLGMCQVHGGTRPREAQGSRLQPPRPGARPNESERFQGSKQTALHVPRSARRAPEALAVQFASPEQQPPRKEPIAIARPRPGRQALEVEKNAETAATARAATAVAGGTVTAGLAPGPRAASWSAPAKGGPPTNTIRRGGRRAGRARP